MKTFVPVEWEDGLDALRTLPDGGVAMIVGATDRGKTTFTALAARILAAEIGKVAVVDATGKLLDTGTIYPHEPKNDWKGAINTLQDMINRHHVTLITIGNGTASRETEKLVAELTKNSPRTQYLIVNEAGASVYSASALARQEFPDLTRHYHRANRLWSASYFTGSVSGAPLTVLRQYIEQQNQPT